MSDPLFWGLIVFIPFVLGYVLATFERSRRRRGSDASLRAVDLASLDASVRAAAGLRPGEPIPPGLRMRNDVTGRECRLLFCGDTTVCEKCGLRRDTNDPFPPKCRFIA